MASLNNRELYLKEIYEEIRMKKDPERLINLLKSGSLKPNEKDGLGRCPLMFAVDCEFDLDTCKRLVTEGGCDPRTQD